VKSPRRDGGEEAVLGPDDRPGGLPSAACQEGVQEKEVAEEGAREEVSRLSPLSAFLRFSLDGSSTWVAAQTETN
jgi:hypothetical protein